ncbi:MAG: acetylxylan esterase [Bacteroidia bacterium]|nr:acetylxylan esterase [Bacteroidia bacterium]
MKTISKLLFIAIFSTCMLTTAQGQNIVLKQTNETGIYKKGQKIRVTLFLKDHSTDSVSIKIRRNHSDQVSQRAVRFSGDTILVFDEILNEPSSVIFEASTKAETASIGLIVDPEKFKPGTSRPKDFDQFWKAEKKAIRALPMDVKKVSVKESGNGYSCFDLEINCTGPKPARGYYAKPESAKPKSLPIVLLVHAAGVKGSWCRSEPENALRCAKMGNGTLCFDLNAHGMLDDQPEEYYVNLENGELKDYYHQGLESKKDFYFRGMYDRLIRTLDFLASQPEWDGKRILVIGESQGGGQALAAAGLDKRVSAVVATVPAMCDWGGTLVDRKGGWPQPFEIKGDKEKMLATLPYFDDAHLLKGSKATLLTEIGLIDVTCPSTSVFAAINQSSGKKITFVVPYRPHHAPSNYLKAIWEKSVYNQREAFIKDFLK